MESSPRQQHQQQSHLPSPTSHSSSSSSGSSSNGNSQTNCSQTPILPPSPKPIPTRSEPPNPYPTTFVQADTASFKQIVQMLTGSPKSKPTHTQQQPDQSPPTTTRTTHNIPPIKSIPNKKTQPSSGFKLYERRNSLKNLKINPIFAPPGSGFSPRNKPEILSPSILDFPSLVLSPVTPLIPDPFARSSSSGSPAFNHPTTSPLSNNTNKNGSLMDVEEEEKAIKEKRFYLHPSPATTPREAEPPRLLPLFPVTSPRVSGSASP